MRASDTARLVSLAAIWGASFLFMRLAAPAFGPVLTAELRTLIGGVALAAWFAYCGFDPEWRRWWRSYLLAAVLSAGLPFVLWAYAALTLTAGLLSVLNATSPMWGALCSAVLLRERLNAGRAIGLVIGIVGVAVVTQPQGAVNYVAVLAALVAAFSYGLIATYIKGWARHVPARGFAVGTQLGAGVLLVPFIALWPPAAAPTLGAVASILALGLVCTSLAYVLYFRLIADIGATGALTVTYLIPVFGVLWGVLFLGESLSLSMIAGAALVVLGTVLVLRN
jgi:drug/metabolite transporter (DMT)-like permease